MAINNHFESPYQKKLNKILCDQEVKNDTALEDYIYTYARMQAEIEGSLVVVSDLRRSVSRIFAGKFSDKLGISCYTHENSIWEKEILDLMSDSEREEKFIAELRFFHFLRHQPRQKKSENFLMSKLCFKNSLDVLHRMYYVYDENFENVCYSICIYSPLAFDFPGRSYAVNSCSGLREELTGESNDTILSKRERQVLQLISSGMKSIDIAQSLNISLHTVSRHRQEILKKLQVKNSLEACRVAATMKLI